jgi:hypothetical protein
LHFVVSNGDEVIMVAELMKDDLYRVTCQKQANNLASSNAISVLRWHQRLGHLSEPNMRKLAKMVDGLDLNPKEHLDPCDVCAKGKMTRVKTKTNNRIRTSQVGEIIHTDVWGPIDPVSIGGSRYFVSFTDDFTRKSFVYFMKERNQLYKIFKSFHAMFCTQTSSSIKKLRSDRGGEYLSNEMKSF